MSRASYPTDLSDGQYALIAPLLPETKTSGRTGRPSEYSYREILNALFYQLRSGCSWRMLPHDFPLWDTVYGYFRRWQKSGVWKRINDALREKLHLLEGRGATPSAAIVDSPSVKTTAKGG